MKKIFIISICLFAINICFGDNLLFEKKDVILSKDTYYKNLGLISAEKFKEFKSVSLIVECEFDNELEVTSGLKIGFLDKGEKKFKYHGIFWNKNESKVKVETVIPNNFNFDNVAKINLIIYNCKKNGILKLKNITIKIKKLLTQSDAKTTVVDKSVGNIFSEKSYVFFPNKKILERDFWVTMQVAAYSPPKENKEAYDNSLTSKIIYHPTSALPNVAKKYLDIPAFSDVAIQLPYYSDIIENSDGTFSFDLKKSMQGVTPRSDQPFLLAPMRFVRLMPFRGNMAKFPYVQRFKHDVESYENWKKKYPNFIGVHALSEWANNARNLYHHVNVCYKNNDLNDNDLKIIKERYVEEISNRKDYVEQRLKVYFNRAKEIWFNDASKLDVLEGMWCINHLAAYWGVKSPLIMETSRSFANWQVQLMYNRGAARQFDLPWGWYVANFVNSYKKDGTFVRDGASAAYNRNSKKAPNFGLSLSARKRVFYMAYLSGATLFEREDMTDNFRDSTAQGEDKWKPAEEALMYIDYYNFTKKNPNRGMTYTPVALLVPYDRGACRVIQKPFWSYPYLMRDNMIDAFIATIFPLEPIQPQLKNGVEKTLLNSKYGDIFDIITPDFEKQETFKRALNNYKVAILTTDSNDNSEMAKILIDYVKNGGNLIINVVQLNKYFPNDFTGIKYNNQAFYEGAYKFGKIEFNGAKVLACDEKNNPIFTVNNYGKGKVIVGTPYFLAPYFDENNISQGDYALKTTISGQRKFPFVEYLLDKVVQEVLPITVKGDIQYGLNKTDNGWWLYLFNNNGVINFAGSREEFDFDKTANVEVDFQKENISSVFELLEEKKYKIENNILKTSIKPGEFAIFEIKCNN